MPRHSFDYAIIRVMPRVERGEQVNVGVILHCRTLDFLAVRIALDRARILALAPDIDLEAVEAALAVMCKIGSGDATAGAIARLPSPERFHWLVAPRSTIVQTSPVHSGLCDDPQSALDRLLQTMVLPPSA
jgi:hypothetical protein